MVERRLAKSASKRRYCRSKTPSIFRSKFFIHSSSIVPNSPFIGEEIPDKQVIQYKTTFGLFGIAPISIFGHLCSRLFLAGDFWNCHLARVGDEQSSFWQISWSKTATFDVENVWMVSGCMGSATTAGENSTFHDFWPFTAFLTTTRLHLIAYSHIWRRNLLYLWSAQLVR